MQLFHFLPAKATLNEDKLAVYDDVVKYVRGGVD